MTPPARIRLACLDMAGTTVHDGGLVDAAFTAAMDAVDVPDAERAAASGHVHRTMGLPKETVFRGLLHDEARVARAVSAFDAAVLEAIRTGGVVEVAGATDTFAALRDLGVAVCLTTGFTGDVQSAIVRHLGWVDAVDLALCPDLTVRGRPFPDLILTAVLRLGIDDVAEVAVAGDTANDLWSGHRAGAGVLAGVLTGAHSRAELEEAPHTHVLDSIADLPGLLA